MCFAHTGRTLVIIGLAASILKMAAVGDAASASLWNEEKDLAATTLISDLITKTSASPPVVPDAISVAIGLDGELVYSAGMGVAMEGVPAEPVTRYKVGSITKQFTAAAVLNLIESGAKFSGGGPPLGLDTKLVNLVPETGDWEQVGQPPITVRSLLSMSSGLPNFTRRPPPSLDPWGGVSADQLQGALPELRRSDAPGFFEYSNTGYFLLSVVMQAAGGGRTYQKLMKEFAFSKAGLKDTGFPGDDISGNDGAAHRIATPHYHRRPAFTQPDWLRGSGDVVSSVVDLFKWNKALLEGRVVGDAMRQEMFSDASRVDVWTYYGMGWFINHKEGRDTYFHSGSVPGYTGFNLISRSESGHWCSVSILTNSDGVIGLDGLADQLVDLTFSLSR
ncbi:MAG: serine hydrolase domain-containing protein [Hyphomicrobium sp.]